VTIVTSSEPRSVERCLGGSYGSTDGFPVAAEAGRSSWGLPAPYLRARMQALSGHSRHCPAASSRERNER
jgi:hypothetical protein